MIGQLVGSYRVVRKISEGGMGIVYEAMHEGLGRRAAIKLLHAELCEDPQVLARFFNEARATNIIQHPGVVSIYDLGKTQTGETYIIMEYLDGESLAARFSRKQQLPREFVLYIARQLATTLTVVHSKGIVHRDLKPENVMLCPDSEVLFGERAKLLDFGIAKLGEAAGASGPGLVKTSTGMTFGTPHYMSPEQCAAAKSVDGRADVYSLGAIIYEMLAGKTVFAAENSADLITMHLYEEPPALRAQIPNLPPQLDELVTSMLTKEPAARLTMAQVVAKLEALGAPAALAPVLVLATPSDQTNVDPLGRTMTEQPAEPPPAAPVTPLVAQLVHAKSLRSKRVLSGPVVGALLAGTIVGTICGVVSSSLLSSSPPPPVALNCPPAPGPVLAETTKREWRVISTPPGAAVVRKSDGAVLGHTPWLGVSPTDSGSTEIVLKLAGYDDFDVALQHEVSCLIDKPLSPKAVAPVVASPNTAAKRAPVSHLERHAGRRGGAAAPKEVSSPTDSLPSIAEPEEFQRAKRVTNGGN